MLKNEIIKLNKEGYSNRQISNILKKDVTNIRALINKYKIKSNRYDKLENTNFLIKFIIASILGDGGFKNENRMIFAHSLKQEEYAIYKHGILNKYNLSGKISKNTIYNDRYINGYFNEIRFGTKTHSIFNQGYNLFYKDGKRTLNQKILDKYFDDYILAIWYFDDGHICTRSYQITCQSLSEKEVSYIKDLIKEKCHIKCTYDKNHNLYITSESRNDFTEILNNNLPVDSLKYKIRGSDNNKFR